MNSLLQSFVLRIAVAVVATVFMMQSAGTASAEEPEAYLKDLHIRQMPMATGLTPPPSSPTRPEAGLAVSASVDRPDRSYQHGENLVLTVETTEDAYVWVFDTGTSGKVHQIYPNQYETTNFLAANVPIEIPRADSRYQLAVSHPEGAELITVVASKDKTPLTPELIDTSGGGPFLALRGDAASVAKDLSITLREQHSTWVKDEVVVLIK
jgi:hypothetical protein